jgi:hypothetical protein
MPRQPSEFRAWSRRGAVCGLEATRIGAFMPFPEDMAESRIAAGVDVHEWVVRFTSILFARHRDARRIVAAGLGSALSGGAGHARVPDGVADVRAVADPSRRHVADTITDACRYPAALVLGSDRGTLMGYLDSHAGLRLRASFGDAAGLSTTSANKGR